MGLAILSPIAISRWATSDSGSVLSLLEASFIILFMLVLAAKALLRAYGGPVAMKWVTILNLITIPLLLAFGILIILRLASLL